MINVERIRILGDTGSPYTKKMLAVMRYRQIPYSLVWGDAGSTLDNMGMAKPKPLLLPVVVMPHLSGGDVARCDSTPIIRNLEAIYSERSALPSDPAIAFLDYLIEDFGDEWCTKYMFHYRLSKITFESAALLFHRGSLRSDGKSAGTEGFSLQTGVEA